MDWNFASYYDDYNKWIKKFAVFPTFCEDIEKFVWLKTYYIKSNVSGDYYRRYPEIDMTNHWTKLIG